MYSSVSKTKLLIESPTDPIPLEVGSKTSAQKTSIHFVLVDYKSEVESTKTHNLQKFQDFRSFQKLKTKNLQKFQDFGRPQF